MNKPNFQDILDEAPTEVSFAPPLPKGPYLTTVVGVEFGKTSNDNTFVRFPLQIVEALDGVDPDELEEAGGCQGKTVNATFFATPDAVAFLDQFHEHCGINLKKPMSRRLRSENCINRQVVAYLAPKPTRDGKRLITTFVGSAPA